MIRLISNWIINNREMVPDDEMRHGEPKQYFHYQDDKVNRNLSAWK